MRQYSWDEYYEKFYDWAESTQIRNLSGLTNLGPASEVAEIIIELQSNVSAANRLLRKAVAEKLVFSADDLVEMLCNNDEALATEAVYLAADQLTEEDMETLYGMADDDVIFEICERRNLRLPEALCVEDEEEDLEVDEAEVSEYDQEMSEYENTQTTHRSGRLGCFWTLIAIIAGIGLSTRKNSKKHNGRCNGDCANCPPHYGYRYGRWYYGHDHASGCEFGGNRCSGRMD